MASKTTITANDILNAIRNTPIPTTNNNEINSEFTNFLADSSAKVVDISGQLIGALKASGGNFVAHYKMERGVQQVRSEQRLKAAAERAATRINAALK